jgi:hypothetical protein
VVQSYQQSRISGQCPQPRWAPQLEEFGSNRDRLDALGGSPSSDTPLLDEAAQALSDEGNAGPLPSVEDGTPEQIEIINQAVDDAREMVAAGMALMERGPAEEPGLFLEHFKTTDEALLACAEDSLRATQQGLAGQVPVEVESWNFPWPFPDAIGHVWGGPFRSSSNIHLYPSFFEQVPLDRAHTLVHEASHKYGGTDDHEKPATPELAIADADTYALFCRLEQQRADQEEDEEAYRRAEQAAAVHAQAIWEAYQAGQLVLGESMFTTSDGISIHREIVSDTVYTWFLAHEPVHFEEVAAWVLAHGIGPVTCQDGTVIREDLAEVVLCHIS